MKTKLCKCCNTEKPLKDFYRNTSGYYFSRCQVCHNVKQKELSRLANISPAVSKKAMKLIREMVAAKLRRSRGDLICTLRDMEKFLDGIKV